MNARAPPVSSRANARPISTGRSASGTSAARPVRYTARVCGDGTEESNTTAFTRGSPARLCECWESGDETQ